MSRTNPYKKKRRIANKTVLLFGEGLKEEKFLKYLRSLYSFNQNVFVTVKKGNGGAADKIINNADKLLGAFDKKIVVLDNDKPKKEMEKARKKAREKSIVLIENTPCLEYLLLKILDQKPTRINSKYCKKYFKKQYGTNDYFKLFPKKLLDQKRKEIIELDKLISIFKGQS